MADPNVAETDTTKTDTKVSLTGTPNTGDDGLSSMLSDLSDIRKQYDPQIAKSQEEERGFQKRSIAESEKEADYAEHRADEESTADQQVGKWLENTPTRQAAYQTTMQAAPVLAILTALGGKFTRLNGMQMLSATSGIVQGMNAAAENRYTDSYNQWMAGYQRLKDQQSRMERETNLMLEAYRGRADAYQRATEAARRMTGDLLTAEQQKTADRINIYKAQSEAIARLDRVKIAYEQMHERVLKDMAQENHWKALEARSSQLDQRTKALMAQAHNRWLNAKAQIDEAMKHRGQVSSDLSISEDVKAQILDRLDAQVEQLQGAMDEAQSDADGLASTIPPVGSPNAPPPNAMAPRPGPGAPARTPAPGVPRTNAQGTGTISGTVDRSAQLPASRVAQLKANIGQPVQWKDGTVAKMNADGTVEIITAPPTVH